MLRKLLLVLLLISVLSVPLAAQDDVVAEGLLNPRQMTFDAEGNLFVAEAGVGGDLPTADDETFGASSRISMIAPDGSHSVVVRGLTSYRTAQTFGAHAVQVTDESYWIVTGETRDFSILFSHALLEVDRETGRVKNYVDLLTLELEQDPDGNANEQSNATDLAVAEDGTVYIANAGCNCLMSWSSDAGLGVVHAWSFEDDNPVPTSVEIGPNGDIYVGFLTGFPFPEGGSRVERWSGGELVETYEGLTAVTGLLVTDDGTIYAVEYGVFQQGQGWAPGRVVMVGMDGVTPVMADLPFPYGIAQAPDGTIVVSLTGPEGSILTVPMGG